MNIGSKNGYPAGALSNFTPRKFVFDGVECNSIEGFLQATKFDKPHMQVELCKFTGLAAKKKGSNRNNAWKRTQTLWWNGHIFPRDSKEYQDLLTRLYDTVFDQCKGFRDALKASNGATFTHSIGRNKIQDTVLTEREFVGQLHRCRDRLKEMN